ncbi:MAG: UbiA family prenyltransferase [Chlorobiaceae bacterium]|nr:UbiA family prenyltransferase [Chlorobiaceae bacterium]
MASTKIVGLLHLFRFELSFAAGACVLLAELLALGGFPSPVQAVCGFLSFFCISATALILNDCFDIETDRINAPSRPLPAGLVTKTEALVLSAFVTLSGFLFAGMIGVEAFIVVFIVWLAGFLYNWRLKKSGFIGNLLVGFSVGMTFIFGGIAVGKPFEEVVWFLAVMTMLVDLGEEIAADALDVDGDRKTGSRSLAVLFGPPAAMRVAAGVFAAVVACSAVPFLCGWLEWFYLPPVLMFDAVIVYSVNNLLNPRISDRISDIRRIYLGGSGMILVFIVIRLVVRQG